MEYGCPIFPLNNSSVVYQLKKIQFMALRLCLGLRRTTSTNVLLAESGESSLKLRFTYLTSRYIFKIFSLDDHPTLNKLYYLHWCVHNSRKKDPSNYFLLYRYFRALVKYKKLIVNFTYLSVYSIDYWAYISFLSVRITSSLDVENIKNSPIPQYIFFHIYNDLLKDHIPLSTRMPLNQIQTTTLVLLYIPPPLITFNYSLIHPLTSTFSAETFAIL